MGEGNGQRQDSSGKGGGIESGKLPPFLDYRNLAMPITVNGMPVSDADIDAAAEEFADSPNPRQAAARTLVVRMLLRQRATVLEIEAEDEASALEALLEQEVSVPAVAADEVLRYFEGNRQKFRSGDLFEARHILFDTVTAERAERTERVRKAEGVLLLLKGNPENFEQVAKETSTCTTAKLGGQLGQLSHGSVVPEFWSALLGHGKPGLLPHLVKTRFGHHIVQIDRCAMGQPLPFEAVQVKIADYLATRLSTLMYQQYVATLIEHADIQGIDLSDQRKQAPGPGLPTDFSD